MTTFTDELRQSKKFRERSLYVDVAIATFAGDKDIFKKHFAKNIAADLEEEKCKCVKITLAKLCDSVPESYSKSLDKVRSKLLADDDVTILQYMPSCNEKTNKAEYDRRYLAPTYGEKD